jgi:hypothetical protein
MLLLLFINLKLKTISIFTVLKGGDDTNKKAGK